MNKDYILQQLDDYNSSGEMSADEFFPQLFDQFGGSVEEFIEIVSSQPEQSTMMDEVYLALRDADIITSAQALDMSGDYTRYGDDAEKDTTPDPFAGEEFRDDMEEGEYLDETTKRQWQHRAGIIK